MRKDTPGLLFTAAAAYLKALGPSRLMRAEFVAAVKAVRVVVDPDCAAEPTKQWAKDTFHAMVLIGAIATEKTLTGVRYGTSLTQVTSLNQPEVKELFRLYYKYVSRLGVNNVLPHSKDNLVENQRRYDERTRKKRSTPHDQRT